MMQISQEIEPVHNEGLVYPAHPSASDGLLTIHALERELRRKESLLEAAHRLASLGSWSLHLDNGTFRWSDGAHRVFSMSREELDGFTLAMLVDRIHPEDTPGVESVFQEALVQPKRFNYQYRFRGASGEEKFIKGVGESKADLLGQVCCLYGTVMDATEHEQARRAVEMKEARLRLISDSSNLWLWEQDEQFRFTLLTEGRGKSLTRFPADAIGKCRWNVPEARPTRGTWDDHRRLLEARKPFVDFEYQVGSGSTAVVMSTTGIPVYGADGQFVGYRGTALEVTQLKRAQADAEQAHGLLKLATRLGRVGAWTVSVPDMRVVWSSDFLQIHEFEPHALLAIEDILVLIHPRWRGPVKRAMLRCAREGIPVDKEVRASTAKGNMVWLRVVAEAVRDERGTITSFQGAIQDITESKNASDSVRRLSEELTSTLESLTDAFIMVDRDARLTYVNAEAERLLGQRRTNLLGKVLWEHFPTSAGTVFQVEYERALANQTTARFEAYSNTISAWVQVAVYPSAHGLAVYFRDISESRNAREALVESEERYRLLFETSGEAIIKASADGKICDANPTACRMFGRDVAAMCSFQTSCLVSPSDGRLQDLIRERLKNGGARGELTMIRADGTLFEAEVTTSTYQSRDGTGFVNIVIRDVTERLQFQRDIVALNADLSERVRQRTAALEAANNELKGFAHVLAHDLQQPVCAIKAFSTVLDAALAKKGADKEREYSSRIQTASQQMLGFIDAMLSLAKISQAELRMSLVDLSAIAMGVLDELQQQDRSRRLLPKVQTGLRAWGDPRLLRMLLANLLGNAYKFTARCDVATISFTADVSDAQEFVFCVRDNGVGFDMADAHKLFGNFQRLHKESEFHGTGIGLANVLRIVTRHGGRVWADSRPGEGAAFRFTLRADIKDE